MFCHIEILIWCHLETCFCHLYFCMLATFKLSKILRQRKPAELRTKFASLNLKIVILKLENVCHLETWKCCYLDTLLVGHLETWNFVVASPLFRFKGTKVTTNGGNLSLRWESHPLPTLIRYGSSSDPLQLGQVDNLNSLPVAASRLRAARSVSTHTAKLLTQITPS